MFFIAKFACFPLHGDGIGHEHLRCHQGNGADITTGNVRPELISRHIKSCYIEPNIQMFAFAFIEADLLSNFLCFCLLVPFLVTSAGITSRTTPTSVIGWQLSSLFCSSFPSCSIYKALCTGRLGHWQF